MSPARSQFGDTRWSIVLAAQAGDDVEGALAELCRAYWQPLYAFVRRSGHAPEEAEDLTQEFFARLLAKDWLAGVDRAKGRFRAFLLATMKHFLANEWRRTQAQKRGGNTIAVPLDAEERYALEPADMLTPERLYERRWALTVIENVFATLRAEMEQAGKRELFETLKDFALARRAPHFLRRSRRAARPERRRGKDDDLPAAQTLPRSAPRAHRRDRRHARGDR